MALLLAAIRFGLSVSANGRCLSVSSDHFLAIGRHLPGRRSPAPAAGDHFLGSVRHLPGTGDRFPASRQYLPACRTFLCLIASFHERLPPVPAVPPPSVPLLSLGPLLQAIGDKTRCQILKLLIAGEPLMVKGVGKAVGLSDSAAGKHLAVLRKAGVTQIGRADATNSQALRDRDQRALARFRIFPTPARRRATLGNDIRGCSVSCFSGNGMC